ncbi:unnamed protein product [Musa acuminata subsp. burmannicoides]
MPIKSEHKSPFSISSKLLSGCESRVGLTPAKMVHQSRPLIRRLPDPILIGDRARLADATPTQVNSPERNSQSPKIWRKLEPDGVGLAIVAALERTRAGSPANVVVSTATSPIAITPSRTSRRRGCPEVSELCSSGGSCEKGKGGGDIGERVMDFYCESLSPPTPGEFGGFRVADFLSHCHLCRKRLHGKDIYMYRGEKAFCSMECRYQQIVSDEYQENCGSEATRPTEISSSPYSGDRIFSPGIVTRSFGHFLKRLSLSLCAMLRSAATRRFLSALASRHRVATAAPSALRCFSTDAPPLPTPPPAPSEEQPRQQKETSEDDGSARRQRAGSRTTDGAGKYEEEQARVLRAALPHVVRMGWSESAMIAGARDAGVSPAIVGSIPRKEAALVEFFMDDCLQKLIDKVESGDELKDLILSNRLGKLIRIRLKMQAPYISKWPQALSIQAQPANLPTSFKQRAELVDEIWHAAGDSGSDIDWYVKRTVLGGIYSTTEVYMVTDHSLEFQDTWRFLDRCIKDAFDFQKTVQEAAYLAEAVGAGMGNTMQGFVKRILQR